MGGGGAQTSRRPSHPLSHMLSTLHPFLSPCQIAIERAVQQHRGDKDAALDAAIVSVGALFAKKVAGRVSTEVDPRAADDADALVRKGKAIAAAYKDLGVGPDKFLLRIPGEREREREGGGGEGGG